MPKSRSSTIQRPLVPLQRRNPQSAPCNGLSCRYSAENPNPHHATAFHTVTARKSRSHSLQPPPSRTVIAPKFRDNTRPPFSELRFRKPTCSCAWILRRHSNSMRFFESISARKSVADPCIRNFEYNWPVPAITRAISLKFHIQCRIGLIVRRLSMKFRVRALPEGADLIQKERRGMIPAPPSVRSMNKRGIYVS